MSPASKQAAPADDLVDVVVARGHTVIDATGAQVLAGQTARIAATEVARLIESGFIVDPNDKPAERIAQHTGEADRLAWNLYVSTQNAAAVAIALRPSRPGGEQRAQQLAKLAEEIQTGALRLLAQIRDGATGQPATAPMPLVRAAEPQPTREHAS